MSTTSLEVPFKSDVQHCDLGTKLRRRAYLNALAALLDYSAKVVVAFVVTPVLVAGLGTSLFGVWQMLSRMVTYMSAADGRPTQALKWVIANRQADEDFALKRRHIGSALGVWLIFLPILTVSSVILVWIAPNVTGVPPALHSAVRMTCVLLMINLILANLAALPESVLRGMNLGYKRMGFQAGLSVVGGVLTAGAVYAGWGLIGVAGAQVALGGLTGVLFWVAVKKFVPWFGIAVPSWAEVRSFLGLSNWCFAWRLINKLLMASDVLILGVVASASAVTTYTLTSYSSLTLLSIISMVVGAAIPGLGGIIGQKQFERAARLRQEMMAVTWLLSTALGSSILLWNRSFVSLWVGADHYAGSWANLLIVFVILQMVFIRNDAFVIDLTLQLRKKVILGAVASLLSVVFSVCLIPSLGIAGLCLGMLGGRLLLTISYPLIVKVHLGQTQEMPLLNMWRAGLVTALMFVVAGYLGRQLQVDSWIEWFVCVGVSFGLLLGIALVTGLSAHSRRPLIKRLFMIRALRSA